MDEQGPWSSEIADYWFDEDGILHGLSKEAPRTVESLRRNFDLIRKITEGKKVCALIDNTHTNPYDMDAIMYMLHEFHDTYKAVAFVARSPIGKMVGTISAELNPDGVPIRVFPSTEEAKEWLMHVTDDEKEE